MTSTFRDTSSGAGMRGVAKPSRRRSSRAISSFRLIAKCSAGGQFNQPLASVSSSVTAKTRHRSRQGIIAELRGREDERGFVRLERRSRFAPGDQIRVVEGIFDACLGLFEDMVDHERVAILLDLLGRKVRVVLHGDAVAAA